LPIADLRPLVLKTVKKQNGKPYVWDTNGPRSFDCSGLVHYVLRESLGPERFPLEYKLDLLPGYTSQSDYYHEELLKAGASISCDLAKDGDIIFFKKAGTNPNHIGFITNSKYQYFIAAQNKLAGVRTMSYGLGSYWASRRPECFRNIWAE
jgi:cell wall-associated NlpC family hydrolase